MKLIKTANVTTINFYYFRLFTIFLILFSTNTIAENEHPPEPLEKQVAKLRQELNTLKKDVAHTKSSSTSTTEQTSINTMSSKLDTNVPGIDSDIYGQVNGSATAGFNKNSGTHSSFDIVDFSPIFLVRYSDSLLLRAALDFPINNNGSTDVSLDFANINWFLNDNIIIGMGKFDSLIGQFVQNLSPNWINKLPTAPTGFNSNQAAPQSDVGVMLRGVSPLFIESKINYSLYLANGPNATLDRTNTFIDHISTDGSIEQNSNYTTGGRIGFLPLPSFEIGFSALIGKLSIYDSNKNLKTSRKYGAIGTDFSYQWEGFNFRGELIKNKIKAQPLTSIMPAACYWNAYYLQSSYQIPSTHIEPVLRFGKYYSTTTSSNQRQWVPGLNYWFAPTAVAKISYQFNHGKSGTDANSNVFSIQFAFGF